ncbi:5'-3' exonuclease [Embleya sp. MST-111070]|uniref:5'-3' exonuclease n=1 Tax=Embleya sp. MST-111070 TaxID=3398231 RepID=UPI003F73E557
MSEVPLLLVDGHHLLFRSFFGFPARITSRDKRRDLTGVFGFFALLRVAVRDEFVQSPEIVVVFDGERGVAGRREIDQGYKAQRPTDASALAPIASLPDIQRGLDELNVRWIEIDDAEGDDVIATAVTRTTDGRSVRIMSGDRDFYQLAAASVRILNTAIKSGSRLIGPPEITARYGVSPHRWADLVALLGDKSDNLPGIRGIGPVTARRLLAGGLSLEDLTESGRLTGRVGELVSAGLDRALIVRGLVRMRTDVALPFLPIGRSSVPLPRPADILETLELW